MGGIPFFGLPVLYKSARPVRARRAAGMPRTGFRMCDLHALFDTSQGTCTATRTGHIMRRAKARTGVGGLRAGQVYALVVSHTRGEYVVTETPDAAPYTVAPELSASAVGLDAQRVRQAALETVRRGHSLCAAQCACNTAGVPAARLRALGIRPRGSAGAACPLAGSGVASTQDILDDLGAWSVDSTVGLVQNTVLDICRSITDICYNARTQQWTTATCAAKISDDELLAYVAQYALGVEESCPYLKQSSAQSALRRLAAAHRVRRVDGVVFPDPVPERLARADAEVRALWHACGL